MTQLCNITQTFPCDISFLPKGKYFNLPLHCCCYFTIRYIPSYFILYSLYCTYLRLRDSPLRTFKRMS